MNPLKYLEDLMSNPSNISLDNMNELVETSIDFFHDYMEVAKTGTEEEKKKALEDLLKLKDKLEKVSEETTKKTGLSQEELLKVLNSGTGLSEKDMQSVKKIQSKLTDFSTEILKENSKSKSVSKANKNHRKNILSV